MTNFAASLDEICSIIVCKGKKSFFFNQKFKNRDRVNAVVKVNIEEKQRENTPLRNSKISLKRLLNIH